MSNETKKGILPVACLAVISMIGILLLKKHLNTSKTIENLKSLSHFKNKKCMIVNTGDSMDDDRFISLYHQIHHYIVYLYILAIPLNLFLRISITETYGVRVVALYLTIFVLVICTIELMLFIFKHKSQMKVILFKIVLTLFPFVVSRIDSLLMQIINRDGGLRYISQLIEIRAYLIVVSLVLAISFIGFYAHFIGILDKRYNTNSTNTSP